jgi:hypothetical protein
MVNVPSLLLFLLLFLSSPSILNPSESRTLTAVLASTSTRVCTRMYHKVSWSREGSNKEEKEGEGKMVDSKKEATQEARKRHTRIKTTWYYTFVLFHVMYMLLTSESCPGHG